MEFEGPFDRLRVKSVGVLRVKSKKKEFDTKDFDNRDLGSSEIRHDFRLSLSKPSP